MRAKAMLKKSFAMMAVLTIVIVSALSADDNTIRFAVLSDRTGGHVPGMLAQNVAEIERLKPEFVITVGDMIEGYVDDSAQIAKEWNECDSILAGLSMPLYLTPGNHDIWSDMGEKMFRQFVGKPYRSFDYRGLHIVILDAGRWEVSKDMPQEQFDWLANDLEKNQNARQTFVFLHKPFWYMTIARGKEDKLHDLFVKYGVDAVMSGHYHRYFSGEYDGIKYTSFGGSANQVEADPTGLKQHFGWVTVNEEGIFITPIKLGSILPWDQVTAEERLIFNPARMYSLSFEQPAKVSTDLTISDSKVGLKINNKYSAFPIADTLRWTIPEGWSVEPEIQAVNIPAGGNLVLYFNVSGKNKIYPAPTAALDINYAENKKVTAVKDLGIARQAVCTSAKKVKIDGKIKEACWSAPVSTFFSPEGDIAKTEATKFYFAYDKNNLYLAAYCTESKMDSLVANATEHDAAIYGEDCVGYFIEPDFGSDTIYQIYFSPNGIAFDQKIWQGEDGYAESDRDWNGKYTTKAIKGDNFWSIEVQIPLKLFGMEGKMSEGDKMRLNFRRKQRRLNDAANWQTPIDYYADTYGYLMFE